MKGLRKLLVGFEKETVKVVSRLSLQDLDTVAEDVHKLWTSSTATIPVKFKSRDCWRVPEPPTTSLVLSTLDEILAVQQPRYRPKMVFRTFSSGKIDNEVDPRLAVVQLLIPNNTMPVSLIGIGTSELPDDCFLCPLGIEEHVGAFGGEDDHQFILTPQFTHTDLHIDTADGISAPLGQCEKLWVIYPPTTKNLEFFENAEGEERNLVRLGSKLEGGIVTRTNSSQAIYLPAGCIHSVFTLVGGFLIAIDFSSSKACGALATMLSAGIDGDGNDERYQRDIFTRYFENIRLALSDGNIQAGVQAWIAAEERWRPWAEKNKKWKESTREMWDEWFKQKIWKKKEMCPCGKQKKGMTFESHFQREHGVGEEMKIGTRSKHSKKSKAGSGRGKKDVTEKEKTSRKRKAQEVDEVPLSSRPLKRTKKLPERYRE